MKRNIKIKQFLLVFIIIIYSSCSTSSKLKKNSNPTIENNSDGVNVNSKMNQGVKYNTTRSNMESDKDPENKKDEDKKDDK